MRPRSFFFTALSFAALFMLCLAALLVGWVIFDLPAKAERSFGPANSALDPLQHTYLSALLLLNEADLRQPYDPSGVEMPFQVQLGESTYAITDRLQTQGVEYLFPVRLSLIQIQGRCFEEFFQGCKTVNFYHRLIC